MALQPYILVVVVLSFTIQLGISAAEMPLPLVCSHRLFFKHLLLSLIPRSAPLTIPILSAISTYSHYYWLSNMETGNEPQVEYGFIGQLTDLKYVYRSDIRDRKTLKQNFRQKFEALNRVRLTDDLRFGFATIERKEKAKR